MSVDITLRKVLRRGSSFWVPVSKLTLVFMDRVLDLELDDSVRALLAAANESSCGTGTGNVGTGAAGRLARSGGRGLKTKEDSLPVVEFAICSQVGVETGFPAALEDENGARLVDEVCMVCDGETGHGAIC